MANFSQNESMFCKCSLVLPAHKVQRFSHSRIDDFTRQTATFFIIEHVEHEETPFF